MTSISVVIVPPFHRQRNGIPSAAIREVYSAVGKPVNVVMKTRRTAFSVDELANAGVKRISVGSALALLAYGSLIAAARDIAQSGTFDFLGNVMDFAELDAFFKQPTDQ